MSSYNRHILSLIPETDTNILCFCSPEEPAQTTYFLKKEINSNFP